MTTGFVAIFDIIRPMHPQLCGESYPSYNPYSSV